MSRSLIYRHPALYGLAIRLLYGRNHRARLDIVSRLIPDGASVVELCCGPGTLYLGHLARRNVRYLGIDVNRPFVRHLRRRGAAAEALDLRTAGAVPAADYVVMQASLYHFLPDPQPVLRMMLEAARRAVIVSEPIRNLSTSPFAPLAWLGRRASATSDGAHPQRFTEASLDAAIRDAAPTGVRCFESPGGRERVYVLPAGAQAAPAGGPTVRGRSEGNGHECES